MTTAAKNFHLQIAASVLVVSIGAATPAAMADDTYTLAKSRTHKLQVIADGGTAWCQQTLHLRMILDSDSPDLNNEASQIALMNVLKGPIAAGCEIATAAELSVMEKGATTGTFKAQAATGWLFAGGRMASAPIQGAKPQYETTAPALPSEAARAPAAPARLPRETSYTGALIGMIQGNPALTNNDNILRWWASYRLTNEYNAAANQEFRLQSVIQKAKADLLETVSEATPGRVTAILSVQFGTYDFTRQRFPIELNAMQITLPRPCCLSLPQVPNQFIIRVTDMDAIEGLPMAPALAQAFMEKRTRFGNVDRTVILAATIKLDADGFTPDQWGQSVSGSLESATIFADRAANEPIYQVAASDIEKLVLRKAAVKKAAAIEEERRLAAQRHDLLIAERDRNIRELSGSPAEVRLANWLSSGKPDTSEHLNDLRSARFAAVVRGKPVPVSMLIQTASGGSLHVDTKWPGNLQISLADGQPALAPSGWFLVQGDLSVSEEDTMPPAQLLARTIYRCVKPQCAEATDPAAIVDRKAVAIPDVR